jgi:hypothetical protein
MHTAYRLCILHMPLGQIVLEQLLFKGPPGLLLLAPAEGWWPIHHRYTQIHQDTRYPLDTPQIHPNGPRSRQNRTARRGEKEHGHGKSVPPQNNIIGGAAARTTGIDIGSTIGRLRLASNHSSGWAPFHGRLTRPAHCATQFAYTT